jgi:hypothetical protein
VARRRAAAGGPGGGESIQALRPARARLTTGALALGGLAAVALYALATAGKLAPLALGTGALSLALLLLALVLRLHAPIPWAIVFVASGYLAAHAGKPVVDGWAAVLGVVLFVASELATWSIEHDGRIRSERGVILRRVLWVTGIAGCALLVNLMLLGTAAVSASSGVLLAAVGVAAAVGAVALVLRLVATSR